MSNELEGVANAMLQGQIPELWKKASDSHLDLKHAPMLCMVLNILTQYPLRHVARRRTRH